MFIVTFGARDGEAQPIADRPAIGVGYGAAGSDESGGFRQLTGVAEIPVRSRYRLRLQAGRNVSSLPDGDVSSLAYLAIAGSKWVLPLSRIDRSGLSVGGGIGLYRVGYHQPRRLTATTVGGHLAGGVDFIVPGERVGIFAEGAVRAFGGGRGSLGPVVVFSVDGAIGAKYRF